jgi:hypothetical protein
VIASESYVPAIACDDEEHDRFLFILARASRQMDALEAAEEAAADLDSVPGSTSEGLGPDCLRYLQKIGYRIMPGLTVEDVELLEDMEDPEERSADVLDFLYEAAEQQIRDEEPPEVRQTLVRLRRAGLERALILDMIVQVMVHESILAARGNGKIDKDRFVAALAKLPNLDHVLEG